MGEQDRALSKLRTAGRRLAAATERQQDALAARDDAIRAARAAGATWDALVDASGVTRPTVAKALKRS